MMTNLLRSALVTTVLTLVAWPASSATPGCEGRQYHQLDFWLGSWKVYDDDGKGPYVAKDDVISTLKGCVVMERYQGTNGHEGQGFFAYDASRQLWHQTWMPDSGHLLVIEGRFKGSVLTMSGSNLDDHGKRVWYRGVWTPQSGGVRQTAVTSKDGGRSWQPAWDILFVRTRP